MVNKHYIRTIITQDGEVDDQNSLRHFLLYSNEVELQGIIQTSSRFHWQGVLGAVKPEKTVSGDFDNEFMTEGGPFDLPYRWTGTDWMFRVIDDYEKDYPNLIRHADGYPTPDYLRSVTKTGNIGYEGEREKPSAGSELIKARILDDDPRPLYLQVWGGTNTIARALMDIQAEYEGTCTWAALYKKITDKVIITACGEQDPAYREYIAEEWPGIMFVKTLQMESYAYSWLGMPECESKDTLKAEFMQREILNGKSALADGYCTWLDGRYYEGEDDDNQFGADKELSENWFGVRVLGFSPARPYDFLSEGDSPTFFPLLDWGFRTLEDFSYGGIAGRYCRRDEHNTKGEVLNYWDVCRDYFTGYDGETRELESMWPYVADIQRDFAARVEWASADTYEKGEHKPLLRIREGLDITSAAGSTVVLHAEASSPDGDHVAICFRVYMEASAGCAGNTSLTEEGALVKVFIPDEAVPGDRIHVICRARADGHHRLSYFQQVIITVQ